MAGSGQLHTRIDSVDLERLSAEFSRHNRRLPGAILAAGLLVTSALLAGYDVGPAVQGYSVPAALTLLGGLIMAWRIAR
jgi:ubiquinone biosynthesis protein